VEGEEEKRLGQEPPAVTSEEWIRPAVGAALPGWQVTKNGGDTCLREKERGAQASASARREGESWVKGQRRNK